MQRESQNAPVEDTISALSDNHPLHRLCPDLHTAQPRMAPPPSSERTLALFNHDFDRCAHRKLESAWPIVQGGFDLFSFPSQLRLAWFDIERFATLQAARARAQGCKAVVSHQDQFGALAAALVAERMGWPGTPVRAVLACQHKLYARQVLQQVCPEVNIASQGLTAPPRSRWGVTPRSGFSSGLPSGMGEGRNSATLAYPLFVKPIKAAFSVLAREVINETQLQGHMGFGRWESVLIRMLAQPFERVVQRRLPQAGSSVGMMLERMVHAPQFNLDGYMIKGQLRPLGVVDAVMYPGTQSFMRFDYPTRLRPSVVTRAVDVADRFLQAVGFTHGLFNMEFFYDEATDDLKVIEFNPRMASQFSDLYERVEGFSLHEVALCLAHGRDPGLLVRKPTTVRVASSFVYRSFPGRRIVQAPKPDQRALLQAAYPDALLLEYPRTLNGIHRDQKWLGSCRHGILHLGGLNAAELRRRCEVASRLLGWTPPYDEFHPVRSAPDAHAKTVGSTMPQMPGMAEDSLSP